MKELIIVKPEKCVGCNSCVRTCPAPEANITKMLEDGRFVTTVNPDRCIACGECVRNCSHGARDYIDDTEEALAAVRKEKLIILATPAIKSTFPDKWKGILNWFRKQGQLIYDVSFGADICTWAHLRAIQNNTVGNVVTQPCAAIVKYVETYQPKLLKNLSPIHSPIMCAVVYIKKYLQRQNKIIVLSPCIAKKNEFMETGLVDYNVTFQKLDEFFEKNHVVIPPDYAGEFKYDFEGEQGQVGAIYPRPGGLRDNLWLHDPDLNITTSEGVHKVYPELDLYASLPENKHPRVFDVLSCEFGCNVGAGTGSKKTVFDVMETMREVEKEAKGRRKTSGGLFRGAEDKLFKRFDEELQLGDFTRKYLPAIPTPVPTDKQLDPIFESMGKHTEADKHYDCHACGYRSCRDMAIAIFRGLNTSDNCVVHAKSVLIARHSALMNQHEKMANINAKCKDLFDKLDQDVDNIVGSMGSISESTNATEDRAKVVHDLLSKVITFCSSNDKLDENGLKTLVTILEKTAAAFHDLNDNVKSTNENTEKVNAHVDDIRKLAASINETLKESEKK